MSVVNSQAETKRVVRRGFFDLTCDEVWFANPWAAISTTTAAFGRVGSRIQPLGVKLQYAIDIVSSAGTTSPARFRTWWGLSRRYQSVANTFTALPVADSTLIMSGQSAPRNNVEQIDSDVVSVWKHKQVLEGRTVQYTGLNMGGVSVTTTQPAPPLPTVGEYAGDANIDSFLRDSGKRHTMWLPYKRAIQLDDLTNTTQFNTLVPHIFFYAWDRVLAQGVVTARIQYSYTVYFKDM